MTKKLIPPAFIFFVTFDVILKSRFMRYSAIFSITLSLLLTTQAHGQIEYGGTPLMNHDDFNPTSVIYPLDPLDELVSAAVKSTALNSVKKSIYFAHERPVDLSPVSNGQWVFKEDMAIWRTHIISPGALSMGIYFTEFNLSEDARLFVYTPSGRHIKGGFTRENNKSFGGFSVGHLPGEEIIVELQVRNNFQDFGQLRIGSIYHAFLPYFAEKSINDTGLGTSQDCEIDINCEEGEDWQLLKGSVCHISTGSLLCTGVLVNNTLYNGAPYVFTAEHCINREFRAQSSVFYFGYENSECGINDGSRSNSISGSTLLATGDSLDFTLVKLTKKPPKEFNAYYAGWDARSQNHPTAITLHHPNADAMKISFEMDGTVIASSVPGDLNDYIVPSNYHIRKWDTGSTEGGSSGAPLFNAGKRVVGVLSGGLAACGDSIGFDELKQRPIFSLFGNEDDYYSRISYAWDYYPEKKKQLKGWLDPAGTGQLTIGGLSSMSVDMIEKQAGESMLSVWPNPSNGNFFVSLPAYDSEAANILVYTLTGALVAHTQAMPGKLLEFDLSGREPGAYFVKAVTGTRQITGKLILIR